MENTKSKLPERTKPLPPMPPNIKRLRMFRGYPTPWFVPWMDNEPEFRCMSSEKMKLAIEQKRCWTCGQKLGTFMTFIVGPMCTVNRVNAEPPSHKDCATFAIQACPFLSQPNMKRRDKDLPEETRDAPGVMIQRNPGVMALWTVLSYTFFKVDHGVLFKLQEPTTVEWWAEGKKANRAQVMAALESGIPILAKECNEPKQREILQGMVEKAKRYFPQV